jgi:hypothetical protein
MVDRFSPSVAASGASLYGQPGASNDPSQHASADLRVVWHDDASMGILASEDHVAAGLATECEARMFEGATDLPP